ncbi:MAG: hypothetical protein R3B55_02990 [Candidatus Paceibacterota bacterium]
MVATSNLVQTLVTVPNDTNGVRDVFVYDRTTNLIQKISTNQSGLFGNAESSGAMISSNGQHVVFESIATNLVPNDTNEVSDIFVTTLKKIIPRKPDELGPVKPVLPPQPKEPKKEIIQTIKPPKEEDALGNQKN